MDFKLQPVREPINGAVLPEERDSVFWHHLFMSPHGLPLGSLFQYKRGVSGFGHLFLRAIDRKTNKMIG